MACKPKSSEKKTPKKGKFGAVMAILIMLALCLPVFSEVPLTYFKGLKADSLVSYGGGSFVKHVTFDWISVDTVDGGIAATGRITGTDVEVTDSAKAVYGNFTTTLFGGTIYTGAGGVMHVKGADSSTIGVDDKDTLHVNYTGNGNVGNVRIDGLLYLPNAVTADSITVSTLIANVLDSATIKARFIDTTEIKSYWDSTASQLRLIDTTDIKAYWDSTIVGARYIDTTEIKSYWDSTASQVRLIDTTDIKAYWDSTDVGGKLATKADTVAHPALYFGTGTMSPLHYVDTIVVSGVTSGSVVIISPKAAYTTPLWITTITDTIFCTGVEADTSALRTAGYNYWLKK